MTIEEAIERYSQNAEFERTHGNLQGCLEFNQLADWLKDYKRLLEQEPRFIAKSDGTIEQIKNCEDCIFKKEWEKIGELLSVVLEKQQEPHWDCISRKGLLKKCVYVPIAPLITGESVHYEKIVFAGDIMSAEPIQREPKTESEVDE